MARPTVVLGTDNRRHVVYELRLHNTTTARMQIRRIDVGDPRAPRPLRSFTGSAIANMLSAGGRTRTSALLQGEVGFLFVDLRLARRARIPARLVHRFVLTVQQGSGRPQQGAVVAGAARVDRRSAVRLRPPLRGSGLLDSSGCCSQGEHGRALLPFGSTFLLAQRYATDFVRLSNQGDTFVGDPASNSSYIIYGSQVIAAAPGVIVGVRNDMPDNVPNTTPPLQTNDVMGNRIVEDLGGGRFALYAHLQPGSILVAPGQHVQAGQLIARVGNSGNSSIPHLQFQVMDGNGGPSSLQANGLPYVFDGFRIFGNIPDFDHPRLVPAADPAHRRDQLPLTGDVIGFR